MKKKKRTKEERRERRRERRKKKILKERMFTKRKVMIPCAVCKEPTHVGDRSVIKVYCGNCLAQDPQGVIRKKLGRSVQKITDAYKIIHKDRYLKAKEDREKQVKEIMRAERKKKRIEKKIISNYINRYHRKKKFRIEQGKKPRIKKRWIKMK